MPEVSQQFTGSLVFVSFLSRRTHPAALPSGDMFQLLAVPELKSRALNKISHVSENRHHMVTFSNIR